MLSMESFGQRVHAVPHRRSSPPGPRPPSTKAPHHGMSAPLATPQEMLDRLDARHDELIAKLEELNVQIEKALADMAVARAEPVVQQAA